MFGLEVSRLARSSAEFTRLLELARLTDSPVVALNRAVAVGEAEGLDTGLELIDALEENDDVQDVYANFDIPEQVLEAVVS